VQSPTHKKTYTCTKKDI